jgi:hypothetical protein
MSLSLYEVVLATSKGGSGTTIRVVAMSADSAIVTARAFVKTTKEYKKYQELWSVKAVDSVDAIEVITK